MLKSKIKFSGLSVNMTKTKQAAFIAIQTSQLSVLYSSYGMLGFSNIPFLFSLDNFFFGLV